VDYLRLADSKHGGSAFLVIELAIRATNIIVGGLTAGRHVGWEVMRSLNDLHVSLDIILGDRYHRMGQFSTPSIL